MKELEDGRPFIAIFASGQSPGFESNHVHMMAFDFFYFIQIPWVIVEKRSAQSEDFTY